MKLRIFTILWLILVVTNPAYAGYRVLKHDYDAYRPPAYFEQRFRPIPKAKQPFIDKTFNAEQKRLEEMKTGWAKALQFEGGDANFLVPAPELVESLRPAEADTGVAAEALESGYSLKHLEVLALLRNPGIKAAENRLRAALEAFTQVSALDEILRKYSAFTEDLMPGIGPMKGQAPMRLMFPFPGVLALKGEIVNREVSAVRESLEAARRDAVTAIRKASWNLVYVIKAIQITSDMLELLKQLDAVAQSRYESGKTNYQDVIKIRIRRETLRENLNTLREQVHNHESKIHEILNLPSNVGLGKPELESPSGTVPTLNNLYGIAQQRRQELRRLRDRIGKMELMVEMAETMILPPYTSNFSLYEDDAVNQVGSFAEKGTFSVRVEAYRGKGLPKMPWYGTEDAYIRETRQKLYALKEDLKKKEAETYTMVRDAWFELDLARRETSLYLNDVVQLSRAALDVSTRGYVAGSVAFADVIGSYTAWLQANLTLERKRSDVGIAWANLEQAAGATLR